MLRLLTGVALLLTLVSLAFAIIGMVSYKDSWWKHDDGLGFKQTIGWYQTCFSIPGNTSCYRLDRIRKDLGNPALNISYQWYDAIAKAGYAAFFLSLIGGVVCIIMIICLIIVIIMEEPPRIAVNLSSQNGIFGFIVLTAAWIEYVIVIVLQFKGNPLNYTPTVDYALILVGIGGFTMLFSSIFSMVRACIEAMEWVTIVNYCTILYNQSIIFIINLYLMVCLYNAILKIKELQFSFSFWELMIIRLK